MKHYLPSTMDSSEITLKLEQYDDIFSDFDIRDYSKRSLSVDFLEEIKRAVFDKGFGGIDLILHAPESERDAEKEEVIRERLTAHFKRHFQMLAKEKRRVMNLGIGMVLLGVACMIAATYIVYEDPTQSLLLSFLVIFLEPAAWFLLWEGMDQVIFNSKSINPELHFYKKMSDTNGHIHFKSY